MNSFLVSFGVVALAEIGDKTQLLAVVLAARYRRAVPVLLGIVIATLANHALAAALGGLAADWLGPSLTRWVVGLGFLAMAAWTLIPDRLEEEGPRAAGRYGALIATVVAFFLVEMGDKTQIATIGLAARFDSLVLVTLGTTAGLVAVNVPAVFFGGRAAAVLPLRWLRAIAAALFAGLGLAVLFDFGVLLS